jgi:hypothetical protein
VRRSLHRDLHLGLIILSLFGLAVGRLINWLETRLLHSH